MTRFRDRSIKSKFAILSIITTTTALLVACLAFVVFDVVTSRNAVVRKLTAEANIIGANSAAGVIFNDPEAVRDTMSALLAEEYVTAAGVYDKRGKLFAAFNYTRPPPEWLALMPEDYGSRFEGSEIRLLQPITSEGEVVASVALWSDLAELHERAGRFLLIALGVLMMASGVAYLISSWPQRMILAPILGLAETAQKISDDQDYSVRAVEQGKDELGVLVGAFNGMLGRIQEHERDLEDARDAALEASRLKSAFLANVSHEIRTPLNIILGYSGLIADHLRELDRPADELVDPIRRASLRLTETIDGILDISKIETRTFQLEPRAVALAPLIERQVTELDVLASNRGIRLSCSIAEPTAAVMFDEYCLSHALMNLVRNALKFTVRGEVSVRLYRADSGELAIDVSDTGIGIDPGYLPHLFQPFSQEDPSYTRGFEGSGLGLALAKRYVELNGARISAVSQKGQGSVFTICFARASEIAGGIAPRLPAAPAGKLGKRQGQRPKVLVVEDDDDSREVMRLLLSDQYEVVEAASGAEVRQQIAAHGDSIGIVLMDLSLKGSEDGLQITADLRRRAAFREVPIIATTAHALPEDRARALKAGCDAFLAKPIQPQLLLDTMNAKLTAEASAS